MKNTILLISIIAVFIIMCLLLKGYDSNKVLVSDNTIKKYDTISLMYETSANSGVYEAQNDTNWPVTGYEFNSTLSGCENGSNITWDSLNNKIIITGNISDKCYAYFDIKVELESTMITYSNSDFTECEEVKCALDELYDIFGG